MVSRSRATPFSSLTVSCTARSGPDMLQDGPGFLSSFSSPWGSGRGSYGGWGGAQKVLLLGFAIVWLDNVEKMRLGSKKVTGKRFIWIGVRHSLLLLRKNESYSQRTWDYICV